MDAAVETSFAAIERGLTNLDLEALHCGIALDAAEEILVMARKRHRAVMSRIEDVAAQVATLKATLEFK